MNLGQRERKEKYMKDIATTRLRVDRDRVRVQIDQIIILFIAIII